MRRKDPVKRSIWVCSFLVIAMFLWILELFLSGMWANDNLKTLNDRWTSKEKDFKAVVANQDQLNIIQKKLNSLDRLSTNRLLWGTLLNNLQLIHVDGVQLVRFKGEQAFIKVAAVPAKNEDERAIPRQPACSKETVTITLDGKDWNTNSSVYNKYKEMLSNSEYFTNHLQQRNGFVLKNISTSSDLSDPTRSFIFFSLQATFPEVKRDE
jgi:hypothetical protein